MRNLRLVFIIIYISLSVIVSAQTVSWDGGNGTFLWSDVKNWSGDVLPTMINDVEITTGDTVILNISTQIHSLSIQNSGLKIEGNNVLTINGIATSAVELDDSYMMNKGKITIPTFSGKGILSDQLSFVDNSGEIEIFNIDNIGIDNAGTIVNKGLIQVQNVDNHAISNSGNFENSDSIDILITTANNKASLFNQGAFQNTSSGIIDIIETKGGGSEGILNDGNFINQGDLKLIEGNYIGIQNEGNGTFQNSGDILIDTVREAGINNIQNAVFQNNSGGDIHIQKIAPSTLNKQFGICTSITSQLTNDGNIKIENIGSPAGQGLCGRFENNCSIDLNDIYLKSVSVLNNSINNGVIEIDNYKPVHADARAVHIFDDTLRNQMTGIISIIDHTNQKVDGIENESVFLNEGHITADSVKVAILNTDTSAFFVNLDTITITNSRSGAINTDSAFFQNEGYISIINTSGDPSNAMFNTNSSLFINEEEGDILIDGVLGPTSSGFVNLIFAEFENYGRMIIKNVEGPACFANVVSAIAQLKSESITSLSFCGQSGLRADGGDVHVQTDALLTIGYDHNSTDPLDVRMNLIVDGLLIVQEVDEPQFVRKVPVKTDQKFRE